MFHFRGCEGIWLRVLFECALVARSLLAADRTRRMNENYGVKGSIHTLEQRKPWKYGLDHLPNLESYDVEFSPAGQVLQRTDYTNAERIYRSSRFVHNDAGKLVRTVEFDGAGIELAISEFAYSEGRRVCTTRDERGIVTGRDVDEYDGNLLTVLGTYDGNGQPKRLKCFEYAEGKLSKAVSKYYGPDRGLLEISISHFDSLGRVIEAFGLTPDGKPTGDGRYVYEYDDVGRKHRILSYNDLVDTEIPDSIRGFVYECDEHGNWTERREYHRFRGDSDWTQRITTRRLTYYPVD